MVPVLLREIQSFQQVPLSVKRDNDRVRLYKQTLHSDSLMHMHLHT